MFEQFNVKEDAFPVTPSDQVRTAWYGFSPLRQKFQTLFDRAYSDRSRLCILNRGRLGAGKTHAAKFFCEKLSLQPSGEIYSGLIPLLLEAPKQPQRAFVDFVLRLQDVIGADEMLTSAINLCALQGSANLKNNLINVGVSEDVAGVFSRMTSDNLLATRTYLSGGGTSRSLAGLGVARRFQSDHDYASVVKGLLFLLMHGKSGDVAKVRRVVLWMDEMEDLVFFPTRYYLPFTQALREVIDGAREHLTVMLNFTFSEPAELPTIENVLGQAIMQRVNEHVVFEEPSASDLKEYLVALLADNRVDSEERDALRPFSETSMMHVCKSSEGRTPRFINKLVDRLLRAAASAREVSVVNGLVSDTFVEDNLDKMIVLLDDERA